MKKGSITIIGAGVAGLSAGCFGQMAGYQTTLFESQSQPGGVCTSWKKQGYTIDLVSDGIIGLSQKNSPHHIWSDLLCRHAEDLDIIYHDFLVKIQDKTGEVLHLYSDISRLEQELLSISPRDTGPILDLAKCVRRFRPADLSINKPRDKSHILDIISFFEKSPHLFSLIARYRKMPIRKYVKRFKSRFLRRALSAILPYPKVPVIALFMYLSALNNRLYGYPRGGLGNLSKGIEKRYLELGGTIHFNSEVSKILTRENQTFGVELVSGEKHHSDFVISTIDGYKTIFEMLGGSYVDNKTKNMYSQWSLFRPKTQVSFGINHDFSAHTHQMIYYLNNPIILAGEHKDTFSYSHCCVDPTLSPRGKSLVVSHINTGYNSWQSINSNEENYEKEKQRTAQLVLELLEKRNPGISEKVEMTDVVTPIDIEVLTGNRHGALHGWDLSTQSFFTSVSKKLPGLDNFYMAGHWVEPGGGVTRSALSGKDVIRILVSES